MSDADRLRIIGVLTKGPTRIAEVAAELGIPLRVAMNHLAFLEFVGAVTKADETFSLNPSGLEALSKR
jgi:predicted transcriptional regulator